MQLEIPDFDINYIYFNNNLFNKENSKICTTRDKKKIIISDSVLLKMNKKNLLLFEEFSTFDDFNNHNIIYNYLEINLLIFYYTYSSDFFFRFLNKIDINHFLSIVEFFEYISEISSDDAFYIIHEYLDEKKHTLNIENYPFLNKIPYLFPINYEKTILKIFKEKTGKIFFSKDEIFIDCDGHIEVYNTSFELKKIFSNTCILKINSDEYTLLNGIFLSKFTTKNEFIYTFDWNLFFKKTKISPYKINLLIQNSNVFFFKIFSLIDKENIGLYGILILDFNNNILKIKHFDNLYSFLNAEDELSFSSYIGNESLDLVLEKGFNFLGYLNHEQGILKVSKDYTISRLYQKEFSIHQLKMNIERYDLKKFLSNQNIFSTNALSNNNIFFDKMVFKDEFGGSHNLFIKNKSNKFNHTCYINYFYSNIFLNKKSFSFRDGYLLNRFFSEEKITDFRKIDCFLKSISYSI